MATVTKSIAENSGDYRSTWTLITTVNDIVASPTAGTTFSLPLPIITAKYSNVGGNKNYGSFYGYLAYYSSDKRIATSLYDYSSYSWPANTNKTITNSETSVNVPIAMLFWGHNPTQRSVPLKVMVDDFFRLQTQGVSGGATTDGMYKHTSSDAPLVLFDNVATVTLDAPPTFSNTGVTFDTSYVYTGLTTASVDISELEAKYKGYITSAELKIGAQTATLTGDATNILSSGTLSILLNAEGTFTPTITVTDSRGQTATKTLPSITVSGYVAPSVSFTVARTNTSGVADDEGTSAVLTATIDYVSMVANLTQPTVTVDGVTESVTWYTDRALSSAVNWANYNPTSPITLYGLINGGLEKESSYSIGITPNDSKASGTEITQTLGGAFYTIDFLAGGHGIAFGQPATQDGFECNMPTTFHDTVGCEDTLTAPDMTTQEVTDFVDSLDVGGSGVAVDLVIEEGTSGMWTYRKWSSGIAECWGRLNRTLAVPANGVGHLTNIPDYPITFTNTPIITCSGGGSGYAYVAVCYVNTTVSYPDVWMTNHGGTAFNSTLWANFHVIGRWKE